MKDKITNEIEANFDQDGHVYKFTVQCQVGTSEVWLSGYLPHGNNDIRITSAPSNPQITDLLMVLQYINTHKDWFISHIIETAEK